jgi:hypothetical protein
VGDYARVDHDGGHLVFASQVYGWFQLVGLHGVDFEFGSHVGHGHTLSADGSIYRNISNTAHTARSSELNFSSPGK